MVQNSIDWVEGEVGISRVFIALGTEVSQNREGRWSRMMESYVEGNMQPMEKGERGARCKVPESEGYAEGDV